MDLRKITRIIGIVVLLLGLGGLLFNSQLLAGVMNTDFMLDALRILLGAYLIYASSQTEGSARTAMFVFGVVYLIAFVGTLVSPSMFGMLPHKVGAMDYLLHLGGGLLGVGVSGLFQQGGLRHA